MRILKYTLPAFIALSLIISCSLFESLKEKLTKKGTSEKNETETTSDENWNDEGSSKKDLEFYNKYIEVANKVSEPGNGIIKSYMTDVPNPSTVSKNSFILALSFDFKVNDLERVIKELKRSYYDGGELSKLTADNKDMQNDIETEFQALFPVLEEYHKVARKVSTYYREQEFKKDPSLASVYDGELKKENDKYADAFDRFNETVKKYKPKRVKRDPEKISDPEERSIAYLMNAYENTLDGAESFFNDFEKIERNSDVSLLRKKLDDFEKNFGTDKKIVMSAEYTDRTKYLKYSFEDYFSKAVGDFIRETGKFLDEAGGRKMDERNFNDGYENVVRYYNYMITAYNTSINTLNAYRVF